MVGSEFKSFPYNRPDLDALKDQTFAYFEAFRAAPDVERQIQIFEQINLLRESFSTMYNLCYVRHTADVRDLYYESENAYFDEQSPIYEAINNELYQTLLGSKFRAQLEDRLGQQIFRLAELSLKTFQPEIIEDLQKENTLGTEYSRWKAQSTIEFDGKKYNLSGIYPLEIADDRDLRRRAGMAKWAYYARESNVVEGIFDQMVKTRHQIAQKLGAKNFVEIGYARMRRSDYNPEMVERFRKQVRELIVPLCTKLIDRQARRLQVDRLKWYDEEFKFITGNPRPTGRPDEIVAAAARMYHELSPETGEFFDFMQGANLMDLVNRDGKMPGGYCTYIGAHQAPFIFSNFNGTSGDIDVLTHEAGHAFQVWSSGKRFRIEEYQWPTSDAAEIHSMSMEFFTWPWMRLFFGDQTEKYYYEHFTSAIRFIPYGVAVDEFQHIVYQNPDMTPAERNAAWRNLEKTYLPHRDYDGIEFLENGGFWHKQSHIFNSPFYYIDYALAQICAFQFWVKDRENHTQAWKNYVELCRAGGSRSFLELVALAGLQSPFEDGCIQSVIDHIERFVEQVDDSQF